MKPDNNSAGNSANTKKRYQTKEVVVNIPIIRTPKTIRGFLDFIRGYGVIAIAIGIYLATSLKTVIDSITINIVNPLIAAVSHNTSVGNQTVCLNSIDGVCKTAINYGAVISTIISFLIGAFVLYLMIKTFRLDKFDQKKEG